jgi:AcrR family transcriptional regulator
VVQGERVTTQQHPVEAPRRRGDKQRHAIVQAVRELLEEKPFSELSVSMISDRAGVARSGFYFYFDSKYAVLAHLVGEAGQELDDLTHSYAPRGPEETPTAFAERMVRSAAAVYAHNDPLMKACNAARHTDAEIREILDNYNEAVVAQIVPIVEAEIRNGTADPISDDLPRLVRTLVATTGSTLSGESAFLGPDHDMDAAVRILEKLWLRSLWGGQVGG